MKKNEGVKTLHEAMEEVKTIRERSTEKHCYDMDAYRTCCIAIINAMSEMPVNVLKDDTHHHANK